MNISAIKNLYVIKSGNNYDIIEWLRRVYGEQAKIHQITSGNDKDAYMVKSEDKACICLVEKKKSLSHQYRALRSNSFQKKLFLMGVSVPEVSDIKVLPDGRIMASHEYIEGEHVKELDAQKAYLAGITVAQMHVAGCQNIKEECFGFKYLIYFILRELRNKIKLLKLLLKDRRVFYFPKGFCHRDVHCGNFIFTPQKAYLIDFDRHSKGPFVLEIVRSFKGNASYYLEDFIRGYETVRKLTPLEKQYLQDKIFNAKS